MAVRTSGTQLPYLADHRHVLLGEQGLTSLLANNVTTQFSSVPAGTTWEILCVRAQLVTTATAGNRQLSLSFQTSGGTNLISVFAGLVQTASLTRTYNFYRGAPLSTAFVSNEASIPIPRMLLPAGSLIRIREDAQIDGSADDLNVWISYLQRDIT